MYWVATAKNLSEISWCLYNFSCNFEARHSQFQITISPFFNPSCCVYISKASLRLSTASYRYIKHIFTNSTMLSHSYISRLVWKLSRTRIYTPVDLLLLLWAYVQLQVLKLKCLKMYMLMIMNLQFWIKLWWSIWQTLVELGSQVCQISFPGYSDTPRFI